MRKPLPHHSWAPPYLIWLVCCSRGLHFVFKCACGGSAVAFSMVDDGRNAVQLSLRYFKSSPESLGNYSFPPSSLHAAATASMYATSPYLLDLRLFVVKLLLQRSSQPMDAWSRHIALRGACRVACSFRRFPVITFSAFGALERYVIVSLTPVRCLNRKSATVFAGTSMLVWRATSLLSSCPC